MNKIKLFLKNNQKQFILVVGYLLVAGIGFGLGKIGNSPLPQTTAASNPPSNYSANVGSTQTTATPPPAVQADVNCAGKIKGSSSLIYHVPGGAFYEKTTHPIRCFDTESAAQAAGFRKSSR